MAKKSTSQLQKARGVRIKIIGLGGGGCSIVSEMSHRLPGVGFVAADTDLVNLQRVKNDHLALFSFGSEATCGLGTGMNFSLGQKVARSSQEDIRGLFSEVDLFVLVACLGGGVGSGALPVFVQTAREAGALGIGVFTMPFSFEGQKRQRLAVRSLKEASGNLDARMVLANERIFKVAGEQTSFTSALSLVNQNLVNDLNALIEIIRQPSLINIDFSDLRTVLRGSNQMAFLNSVEARGEKRLAEVLEKMKHYDFYYDQPTLADKALLHVCGGSDLKMVEVDAISREIKKPNPQAQIIFGVDRRPGFKDALKVTLLSINKIKEKPVRSAEKQSPSPKKKKPAIKKKKPVRRKKKSVVVEKVKPKASKPRKVKRLNAIDVKELKKKSEFQKTSQEKTWEIPAFLRRRS